MSGSGGALQLAKQFANKGASGDIKAAKLLLELIQLIDRERAAGVSGNQSKVDQDARARVFARLDEMAKSQAQFRDHVQSARALSGT